MNNNIVKCFWLPGYITCGLGTGARLHICTESKAVYMGKGGKAAYMGKGGKGAYMDMGRVFT